MRSFRRSFLALLLAVFAWTLASQPALGAAAPASMVVGVIKASNVRGDVRKVNLADQSEVALRNGDTLSQHNAIVTGQGESSVVLVFANGSTVRVGHGSRLEIREFLMDPLAEDIPSVAALAREPTKSRTDLRLEFGEMVGNVKTLNHADGSTFSVSTPAGAAGIRGTTFRIVYRPTGNGQAFNFQLSTSEGVVVYQGTTNFGQTEIPVPVGREVALTAQVDPNTRTVVAVSFAPGVNPGAPESAPMSPEATAALREATAQIVEAQQAAAITRSEATTGQPGQSSGQSSGQPGQPGTPNNPDAPGQPGASTPPNTSQPVRPAVEAPRTTPGAGL